MRDNQYWHRISYMVSEQFYNPTEEVAVDYVTVS